MPYNINFLFDYNETTFGPVQRSEALFLYGLCQMVRPQCVLEIGCLIGQSLKVWLNAGVPKIYAVDAVISQEVLKLAEQHPGRIVTIEQDMKKQIPMTEKPDFVFIDASHNFEDNKKCILNLLKPGVLAENAIIALHDTGHWSDTHMDADKHDFIERFGGHRDVDGNWVHHPGEKETIEWVEKGLELPILHFWTTQVARYGISLFQVGA